MKKDTPKKEFATSGNLSSALGQKRKTLNKLFKEGKISKEELTAGFLFEPKDSADYVHGYRSDIVPEKVFPTETTDFNPFQQGYYQKYVNENRINELPYKINLVSGGVSYNKDYIKATGGQMRKATNSQFLPSYVNGVPVYGFGSWLKKNAGNVLQVAGGIGAMFIPGMQGIGATLIGNGVTGALGQELQDKQQKDAEAMQRADAERSFMLNQYNDSQQVFASPEGFAKGGSIHIDPSKRGTFTAAATKHGQSVQGFASQVLANKDKYSPAMVKKAVFAHNFAKANGGFVPTYEQGGFMNGLKFYNDGGDIDGLTYFPVGGTHESNPNNGIPLGGNALVEEGEFMWESPTRGKYIFSNRF